MAKNNNGKFTPLKGKPSGTGKESFGIKDAFAAIDPETENEVRAKYISDEDEQKTSVQFKHNNRNVDKDEEQDNKKS